MTRKGQRRRGCPPQDPDAAKSEAKDAAPMTSAQVQRIARAVAPLVIAQFAAALTRTADASIVFSTRRGCGPEGYSRDAWRDLARRIGRKRGRYFYVTAAQLEAHERGAKSTPATEAKASTWHPSQAAASLGLRVLGGSR
jgi:hypothetical protein